MRRITLTVLILAAMFSSGSGKDLGAIKAFIDSKEEGSYYKIGNENLLSGNALPLFYKNRNYASAWSHQGVFSKNGFVLLNYIRQIDQQGLLPEDYHLQLIESHLLKLVYLFRPMSETEMMQIDVLLTDAFLLLGSHLYYGKVNPKKEGANWKIQRKDPDLRLDSILDMALAENSVTRELDLLAPGYRAYWIMKEELAFFLKLNDQIWPELISEKAIKPGDSNQIIPQIRERLIKLRYKLSDSVSSILDKELEIQVKLFQNDWGLNCDGVIGKSTFEMLNSLPYTLIGRLKVNMERYRWLPLPVSGKYIIVNIANFRLDMISGTDTLISMRVVVGKGARATPVFDDRLSYIVFSPTWTVPQTILKEDVYPQLLNGPEYLTTRKMILLRPDGSELPYEEIDWSTVSKDNFPYMVRQSPGSGNALGRVKFMFPNVYNVYLHDTPSKATFARDARDISSGCIRLEKPFDLALILLADQPEWTSDNIRKAMQRDTEQAVKLKVPIDVVITYLTAWSDGTDRIQFRKDVYNRDEVVLEALHQKQVVARETANPFGQK
jgi:murein L,D-transpeptidase YcbB/YkuD